MSTRMFQVGCRGPDWTGLFGEEVGGMETQAGIHGDEALGGSRGSCPSGEGGCHGMKQRERNGDTAPFEKAASVQGSLGG